MPSNSTSDPLSVASWSSPSADRYTCSSPVKNSDTIPQNKPVKKPNTKIKRPRGRPRSSKTSKNNINTLGFAAGQDLVNCTASLNSAATLKQGAPNFRSPVMRVSPFKTPHLPRKTNDANTVTPNTSATKLTPLTKKLLMVANSSVSNSMTKSSSQPSGKISKSVAMSKMKKPKRQSMKTTPKAASSASGTTPLNSFSSIFQTGNTPFCSGGNSSNYYDKDIEFESNMLFSSPSSHMPYNNIHNADSTIGVTNDTSAGQLLDGYFFTSPVMHMDIASDPLTFPEESYNHNNRLIVEHRTEEEIPVSLTMRTPTKVRNHNTINFRNDLKILGSPSSMLMGGDFSSVIPEFSNLVQQKEKHMLPTMPNYSNYNISHGAAVQQKLNINTSNMITTPNKNKANIDAATANNNNSNFRLRPLLPPITLSNIQMSSSDDDDDDDEYDQRMRLLRNRQRSRLHRSNDDDENNVFLIKNEDEIMTKSSSSYSSTTAGKFNLSVDSDGRAILTINEQQHHNVARSKKYGVYTSTSSASSSSFKMHSSEDNDSLLLSSPFLNEYDQDQYNEAFGHVRTTDATKKKRNNAMDAEVKAYGSEIDHDKTFTKDDADSDEADVKFSAVHAKFQNFLGDDYDEEDDDEMLESAAAQFDARIALMRVINRSNIT